jgi:citrate lyase beta subunit
MLNEIFQFVCPGNMVTERLLTPLPSSRVSIVFDLEDGVQDVIHPERTQHLKEVARTNVLALFQNPGFEKMLPKTGFRINSIHGKEFEHDLKCLRSVQEFVRLSYVVIPKLNSREELDDYIAVFSENNLSFDEFIPIIETVDGYKSLDDILSRPPANQFHRFFWGHHDYNLDAGIFPFAEHRSSHYWELTKDMIAKLENSGYGFINGAFLEVNNDDFLKKIVSGIAGLCLKDFDFAAISYRQVKLLSSLRSVYPVHYPEFIEDEVLTDAEKISLAKTIVNRFQKNQFLEKGFSFDRQDAIIISPHQYLAALKYLDENMSAHD